MPSPVDSHPGSVPACLLLCLILCQALSVQDMASTWPAHGQQRQTPSLLQFDVGGIIRGHESTGVITWYADHAG